MTIQCPPGVRTAAPSPCPTSRKCNVRPRPPSGEQSGTRASRCSQAATVPLQARRRAASPTVLRSPMTHSATASTPIHGTTARTDDELELEVAGRHRGAGDGAPLQDVQAQPRPGRQCLGRRGPYPVEDQAGQDTRDRDRRHGNGREVEDQPGQRDRAEKRGRDRSRRERGAEGGGGGASQEAGAERSIRPSAEVRRSPERGRREPAAEVERRPRIDQQDQEAGGREQRVGLYVTLRRPAAGQHRRERRRPRRRRRPAEEGDVRRADGGGE